MTSGDLYQLVSVTREHGKALPALTSVSHINAAVKLLFESGAIKQTS